MAKIMIGKYEGTIYPENGGFTGALALGFGPDGKRKRLKRKGKTKAEVKDKLTNAVKDLERGVKPDHQYRVEDAVNDFLTAFAKTGRSQRTNDTYRSLADHQIIPMIGHTRLQRLTADQVEAWLLERSKHLTSQTLTIVHGLLKRSIRRAARHDKVGRNVAELVDTPSGQPGRKSRSLSLAQAEALIREAIKPQHRLGAYVVLAIVSGLRTEELRKLRWSDVDLKAKTLYVLRADRHGEETKTPLSRRGLGLADIAVTALSTLRRVQATERLSMGELYQNDDLLFCHEDGRPYTNVEVRTRFRRITAAAGIGEDWNPRELRHTFVSLLSDHGLATQKISDLVGHKHTGITETVYRHQLKPEIRDGAEHMNQILKINEGKSA